MKHIAKSGTFPKEGPAFCNVFHFSSQSATCDRSSVLCRSGAVRAHPFIGSAGKALPQPGDKVRAGNGPHAVCYDENGLFCTERERVRPKQRIHFPRSG